MSISLRKRIRQACLLGCVSGAALLGLAVGQAPAATTVYPGGGSTFTGGTEGWFGTGKECKLLEVVGIGVLCESEVEYSPAAGNPPGSLDAHTKVTLNLLKLVFNSKAVLQSPDFTVTAGGPATLHLDRQFASAGLLSTGAQAGYKVVLLDKTTNTPSTVTQETVEGVGGFVGKDAAVTVTAGHTYAIQIQTETTASAALGLTAATADLRFDNVAITVSSPSGESGTGGSGGKGGSGGQGGESGVSGAGGISSSRLESLIKSSGLVGPAVLKGNRLAVKAKCPAKVGATCTLTLQGVLSRHKAATTARRARLKQGKTKRFALRVKPTAHQAVKAKTRLLFKETVRVGKAKATVYKSLKLVRK